MPPDVLKRFLVRFAVAYVLLSLPWPGFRQTHIAYCRAFGEMIFGGQTEHYEITFETTNGTQKPQKPSLLRVVIVNKALMNYDGSGPVRNLDFDALSVGWRPLALLAALIYATPITWGRRVRAFAFGAIGIHAFLIVFLFVGIWSEANELPVAIFAPVTPFWRAFASGARSVVIAQASLFVPVLLWGVVTFHAPHHNEKRLLPDIL